MYLLQVIHISELLRRVNGLGYEWFIYTGGLVLTIDRLIVKGNWGVFHIAKQHEIYF